MGAMNKVKPEAFGIFVERFVPLFGATYGQPRDFNDIFKIPS